MAPRKKKRNIKEIQKANIKKRLIEISLKVDDFIYKKIPIPVEPAKLYAKEIASYKLQCAGDPRSLQVIEKLTLFMKKIIEEYSINNESQQVIDTSNSEKPILTTFENKTLLPELNNTNRKSTDNAKITDTKLTEEENFIAKGNPIEVIGELDLDRTLSNLSLNCLNNPLQNITTEQFQETLKSVEAKTSNDTEYSNKKNNHIHFSTTTPPVNFNYIPIETTVESYINTDYNLQPPVTVRPLQDSSIKTAINNSEVVSKLEIFDGHLNQTANCISALLKMNNNESINSVQEENINIEHSENKIHSISKNNGVTLSIQDTDTTKTNTSKQRKIKRNTKKKKDEVPNKNNGVTIKRKRKPTRRRAGKQNNLSSKEIIPKKSKKKNASIFNNMDLSWVEGIKYVREVNPEEFGPNKLDDSFWSNSTLSFNWDDSYFN